MLTACRVTVLVKALPHPSRRYGETVCCAGVTPSGEWKRLYPIRFRHLRENKFARWQWVDFRYRPPTNDRRVESCHVAEETIAVSAKLPQSERLRLLGPMIAPSAAHAAAAGHSLALIRPLNTRFHWRPKNSSLIEKERAAYREAVAQKGLFDRDDLRALEPLPYHFRFSYHDANGPHHGTCEDWETSTTFWKWRREYGETSALERLSGIYNDEYPRRGMIFAMGNMAKRPNIWLLLGVIRLDPEPGQLDLL
jgi:hypothetical protein